MHGLQECVEHFQGSVGHLIVVEFQRANDFRSDTFAKFSQLSECLKARLRGEQTTESEELILEQVEIDRVRRRRVVVEQGVQRRMDQLLLVLRKQTFRRHSVDQATVGHIGIESFENLVE